MSRTDYRRWRSCSSKKKYPTQQRASKAAAQCAAQMKTYFGWYACGICKGFHISKSMRALAPVAVEATRQHSGMAQSPANDSVEVENKDGL